MLLVSFPDSFALFQGLRTLITMYIVRCKFFFCVVNSVFQDGTIDKNDLRGAFDNVGVLMTESELDELLGEEEGGGGGGKGGRGGEEGELAADLALRLARHLEGQLTP